VIEGLSIHPFIAEAQRPEVNNCRLTLNPKNAALPIKGKSKNIH